MMRNHRRGAAWRGLFGWILFATLSIVLFMLLNENRGTFTSIPLSEFYDQLESGNVTSVTITESSVKGHFKSPINPHGDSIQDFRADLPTGVSSQWTFAEWVLSHRKGATVQSDNSTNTLTSIIVPLIPWLLIFAFLWFFVFRQFRRNAATRAATPVYIVPAPTAQNPTGPLPVVSSSDQNSAQ
jgi:ATP-dependent Zn protease